MTSIHASIPSDFKDAASEAKRRGEKASTVNGEGAEQGPTMKGESASSLSNVVTRKIAQLTPRSSHQALEGEDLASDDEDASKENDPLLSPSPDPAPSLRRPSSAKRPLSDLAIVEPEYDVTEVPCLSPSEQNVMNNTNSLAGIATSDSSREGLQLAERSLGVKLVRRGLQEARGNAVGSADFEGRPSKRICSDPDKENTLETCTNKNQAEKPLPAIGAATKVSMPASKKAFASSVLGTSSLKGRPRVGLRRL